MYVYERAHNAPPPPPPPTPPLPTHTLYIDTRKHTHIRTHARTPMRAQTNICIHAYIYVNLTKYNQ